MVVIRHSVSSIKLTTHTQGENNLKKLAQICAIGLGAAMLFAGCGAPPPTVVADGPATEVPIAPETTEHFLPCVISDSGGFDDHSFNQSALEGTQDAAADLGLGNAFPRIQSTAGDVLTDNLGNLVAQNCTLITAAGFNLAAPAVEVARNNADVHFLLIDDSGEIDGQAPPANLKPVEFDTAQAAFLAGYVAAAFSSREGGASHVGTFGGAQIPPVTIFMDGFEQGVNFYNEQNGTHVQVTGMNSFTGGFEANATAQTMAQGIIDQGVDVILPVGGPIYQSAQAAIATAGRPIAIIGVDTDLFYSDPATQDIVLTSIMKNIRGVTRDTVIASAEGRWDNTPLIGTLANGYVGLAPFHNFEDQISPEVREKVAQLEADIAAGRVHVESTFNQ